MGGSTNPKAMSASLRHENGSAPPIHQLCCPHPNPWTQLCPTVPCAQGQLDGCPCCDPIERPGTFGQLLKGSIMQK